MTFYRIWLLFIHGRMWVGHVQPAVWFVQAVLSPLRRPNWLCSVCSGHPVSKVRTATNWACIATETIHILVYSKHLSGMWPCTAAEKTWGLCSSQRWLLLSTNSHWLLVAMLTEYGSMKQCTWADWDCTDCLSICNFNPFLSLLMSLYQLSTHRNTHSHTPTR